MKFKRFNKMLHKYDDEGNTEPTEPAGEGGGGTGGGDTSGGEGGE